MLLEQYVLNAAMVLLKLDKNVIMEVELDADSIVVLILVMIVRDQQVQPVIKPTASVVMEQFKSQKHVMMVTRITVMDAINSVLSKTTTNVLDNLGKDPNVH